MVASLNSTSSCFHCGNPAKYSLIFNGRIFCCEGCKTVYQVLQEHDLAGFYTLERDIATPNKVKDLVEFDWLKYPEIADKIINYKSESLCKVSFKAPSIHCSSCIWLLEHLYKIDKGVLRSEVNFVKKEIYIDYDPTKLSLPELVHLLSRIGYEPEITLSTLYDQKARNSTQRMFWYKIGVAGFAFGNIMLLSLPSYFGLDVKGTDQQFDFLFKSLNVILSLPVLLFSAWDFLLSAYRALKHKQVNLEVPLCLGMLALYGNSLYEIISGSGPGYMDSFTALVFFLLAGRGIQQVLMDRMRFAKSNSSYFPLSVIRIEDGKEQYVPITALQAGDTVLIRHQELIPADGILVKGTALVDYSYVTGEALPVTKENNEYLYAGGRQVGGAIELVLNKLPSQSYLMQLWDQDPKKNTEKDGFESVVNTRSKYFTYTVMCVAFAAFLYWFHKVDLKMGIWVMATTLNVSCPCALAVAIPFTHANIMRHLARKQFFLRNPEVIERIAQTDTITFDKTGTLTDAAAPLIIYEGDPLHTDELKILKGGLRQSAHPLSRQLYHFIDENPSEGIRCEEAIAQGLKIEAAGTIYKVGTLQFVAPGKHAATDARPSVWISKDGELQGRFIFHQKYIKGLSGMIDALKSEGYTLALISGDHDTEREAIQSLFGKKATLLFEQKPTDKLYYIMDLQNQGHKVMMVGDGLNDALSLRQSHVGVAVVQEHSQFSPSSDVIVSGQAIAHLDQLISYCKSSVTVVKASFVYASLYNALGLTFAVQGLFSPVFAALLMPISSVMVVLFATMLASWKAKQILK